MEIYKKLKVKKKSNEQGVIWTHLSVLLEYEIYKKKKKKKKWKKKKKTFSTNAWV